MTFNRYQLKLWSIGCPRGTLFPLGLENLEKTGERFPVRVILENFAKIRKVREFNPKFWKNLKKLYWKIERKYWKSWGNLSASNIIENPTNMVPYFKFKKKIFFTNIGNLQKILETSGNFFGLKKGEP